MFLNSKPIDHFPSFASRTVVIALLSFAIISFSAITAPAQWTAPDGQGNISNTNTGNVGIGTSSPDKLLTVQGAIPSALGTLAVFRTTGSNNGFGLMMDATGAGNNNLGLMRNGIMKSSLAWENSGNFMGFVNLTYSPNYFSLRLNSDGSLTYHDGSSAAERFRVTASGNVGIGTPTPVSKLHVDGDIRSNTGIRFQDGTLQTTASLITGISAGSGLTGGGTSGGITLNITAGTGVSVAADSISVNYGSSPGTAVEGNKAIEIVTNALSGLTGGGSLTLGTGGALNLTNSDRGSAQSIFKNVANAAGTTQFSANSNSDSLSFAGAGGTSVTFDGTAKKITIDGSTSTPSAANIAAGQFGQNTGGGNYTFPGNVTVDGVINAKYQDVAEWVPSIHALPAGTVVTLDPTKSNHVKASSIAYDTRVAGVISPQPGIALGEKSENKVLVATTGRVKVMVDASAGPIGVGDLLVTSDIAGVAMKSEPVKIANRSMHMPGTLLGKALEPLARGRGEILVLLSLQ